MRRGKDEGISTGESAVVALHDDVDRRVVRLHLVHAARLTCHRGCSGCCVDELTVFEAEAERVRARHGELLASGDPHAEGGCAFLDGEGGCRIYEDRPYVCRTQGLPLRWLDELDGDVVERRDICPLNDAGTPIEELDESECWTLGPFEEQLGRLQLASDAATGASASRRVALRALFAHTAPGGPTKIP